RRSTITHAPTARCRQTQVRIQAAWRFRRTDANWTLTSPAARGKVPQADGGAFDLAFQGEKHALQSFGQLPAQRGKQSFVSAVTARAAGGSGRAASRRPRTPDSVRACTSATPAFSACWRPARR